uniref:DUF19 domain-containing protein n=1 Tax=Strongyloides papillosus TaxID=174720 RepID=A0A0N5B853_STREA
MYQLIVLLLSFNIYLKLYCWNDQKFTEEDVIKLKLIVAECNVPMVCRRQIINDLKNRYQLSVCDEFDIDKYYKFGRCLDLKYNENFNLQKKYSFIHGEVCCENIPDASEICQKACRNAFYGISMDPSFKEQQLKMLCNTINFSGDEKILKCAKYIQRIK